MRLIDADELKGLRDKYIRGEVSFDGEYDLIDKCPTVDAVPVVRCKDCVYDRPDNLLCKHWCSRFLGSMEVREDDFCSYGRRKDGDN